MNKHAARTRRDRSPCIRGRFTDGWHPATFPWPRSAPGRKGVGQIVEVALAVPPTSLSYWQERLLAHGIRPHPEVLGFSWQGEEEGWHRYGVEGGGSGCFLEIREAPDAPPGAWGPGTIHHVAWRVRDEAEELEVRTRVATAGCRPTPVIDRFWFTSVYFLEPGGVLYELATDGPGFATDEPPEHLGESLVLPPWLEPHRQRIEAVLPPVQLSYPTRRG